MSDNTINKIADATRAEKGETEGGRAQIQAQVCAHGIELVGGFCSRCIEVMCAEAVKGPNELEMHRLAYQMCKSAGFEGPEELLSAYRSSEKKIATLSESIEEMRTDMRTLWQIAARRIV